MREHAAWGLTPCFTPVPEQAGLDQERCGSQKGVVVGGGEMRRRGVDGASGRRDAIDGRIPTDRLGPQRQRRDDRRNGGLARHIRRHGHHGRACAIGLHRKHPPLRHRPPCGRALLVRAVATGQILSTTGTVRLGHCRRGLAFAADELRRENHDRKQRQQGDERYDATQNHGAKATTFRVPDATPGRKRHYIAVSSDAIMKHMPNGRCIHITSILLLAALVAGTMIARACPRAQAALNERNGNRHALAERWMPADDTCAEDDCCSHAGTAPAAEGNQDREHGSSRDGHERGHASESCCVTGCACCAIFPHLPVVSPASGVDRDHTPYASYNVGLPPATPPFPPDHPPC